MAKSKDNKDSKQERPQNVVPSPSEDNKDSKQEQPQNVVPSPSHRIRVRINGMGIVDENAASMEAALARADEIVAKGITQKVPNTRQTAVHPPHSIQRVEIEPLR